MKIEAKAMFFNSKMDYLPYYKTFYLDIDENANLKKVCELIKKQDFNYDYLDGYFYLKIGDKVVSSFIKVKDIVKNFGKEFTIEPVSKFRSINDLIIDDKDFYKAFELIKPFANKRDFQYFKSLYDVHYASATFEYSLDYIGDAVLIVAYEIIKRDEKNKDKILKAISENVSGLWDCEYENRVFMGKDYSNIINELKNMAKKPEVGFLERIFYKFSKEAKAPKIDNIKGLSVAVYFGDEKLKSILKNYGANIIEFSKERALAGQTLVEVNPKMAFKKGGAVLLDAMDNSAEILVCAKDEDAKYFRSNFKNFEKTTNREIYLEIVSFSEIESILKEEVK